MVEIKVNVDLFYTSNLREVVLLTRIVILYTSFTRIKLLFGNLYNLPTRCLYFKFTPFIGPTSLPPSLLGRIDFPPIHFLSLMQFCC